MIRCDALIVGGGPAGLAAAIALRQKGLEVLIVDALHPPIDKACGEGLLPDSQTDVTRLGISISDQDGAPLDGIAFLSQRSSVMARFEHGAGIGIRRLRLHSLLVDRCSHLGVQLMWGSRVSLVDRQTVLVNRSACLYRYLIGADGQSSAVRRWSGLDRQTVRSRRFGIRQHFRVKSWSRMVEVHWGDLGQGYVTPVGPEEVCVATLTRDSSAKMEALLEGLPTLMRKLHGSYAISSPRGAITTTRKIHRVTAGNVALAGDASGSADAVTGEGLALSFRQALLLADAIDADDLAIYEAGHSDILRLPHLMSRVLLSMDRWPWFRDRALAMLVHDPQLFGRMLSAHLGEQSLKAFLLRDGVGVGWHLLMPPVTTL